MTREQAVYQQQRLDAHKARWRGWYAKHKAADDAIYRRMLNRHQKARWVASLVVLPEGRAMAHCGTWHPLLTVPMPCPTCGTVLLKETA